MVKYIIEEQFTLKEQIVINIVEERGVAVFPFANVIDEMFYYCQNYIKTKKPTRQDTLHYPQHNKYIPANLYNFPIPNYITKKITWIHDLEILISLYDVFGERGTMPLQGDGEYLSNPNVKLIGDQVNNVKLNITIYSIKGEIIKSTLLTNLYHELNHIYEEYQRLCNNKKHEDGNRSSEQRKHKHAENLYNISKMYNQQAIMRGATSSDEEVKAISNILYRLFIPTEFNAFVAGLYGDLQSMNSDNFTKDFPKTSIGKIYQQLKNYLELIKTIPENEWYKFSTLFNVNPETTNFTEFKELVITEAQNKLNEIFRRFGKVATAWYDKKNHMIENYVVYDGVNNQIQIISEEFKDFYNRMVKK
jgi:hypothetical protein